MTGQAVVVQKGGRDIRAALVDPRRASPQWLTSSLDALTADFPPRLPAERAPTEDQRRKVQEMAARLDGWLEPAPVDAVGTLIAKLHTFLSAPELDEGAALVRAQAYLDALEGAPAFALDEAYRRIVSNEAGLSTRWMPTPPDLHTLVRDIARPAREHVFRLRQVLAAKVIQAPQKPSPERAAQVVAEVLAAFPALSRRRPSNPAGVDHSQPFNFAG